MTRLEKYLITSASDIMESESTISRYFVIENIIIRLSDHLSFNTKADMQIIVPKNKTTSYIVAIKDSTQCFVNWNAKQIIEFIPALQIIKSLTTPIIKSDVGKISTLVKIQQALKEPTKSTLEIKSPIITSSSIKEKQRGAKEREIINRSKSTWVQNQISSLPVILKRELKLSEYAKINEDFQIFLSCTSCTYLDVVNIYKILIDNECLIDLKNIQEAYYLINGLNK